ncbi:MAG TPA: F0F1 ATP synthase subunit epsilon [Candidatus Contendobacter sp.]|nr:F0F1 ATP synthase subunit epsilon [Candidatus Contendobacter sp.]HSA47162.1 F0F1 ATP synthase subunit epsilon [Candidatus Competibacteraceae bacterium]
MRLKLLTPTETVMDEVVVKINAEGPDGLFCLLPRHRDWVATLVPGILGLTTPDGGEVFVAVDQGVLVKCGDEVLVSVRRAVRDGDLRQLRGVVEARFRRYDDQEKAARSAVARLEAGVIRRFLELQEPPR